MYENQNHVTHKPLPKQNKTKIDVKQLRHPFKMPIGKLEYGVVEWAMQHVPQLVFPLINFQSCYFLPTRFKTPFLQFRDSIIECATHKISQVPLRCQLMQT